MTWQPPHQFRYVTALNDAVPAPLLGDYLHRLLTQYVRPGGRLILSSYTDRGDTPRHLHHEVVAFGYEPSGTITIDRPSQNPLQTIWIDCPLVS